MNQPTTFANLVATPRLPAQPYPGLRPFLDHEAPLLMGRAAQVLEVVRRLAETNFVAVVGGSGSGKSSLVRAGVVPRLRSAGVGDSGVYWIPVICTPGTTVQASGEAQVSIEHQSPVSRLAWKLSQVLSPVGDEESERERRLEIETMFRMGGGFTRLVHTYHAELPARGPAVSDARFLFVIDQFEELFHPNNRGNADARLMVEAVISHFFNPHPHCFVVLTMRSEHLADCAAYLELPDAINKSIYLVRRLNEQELHDAIVGPAQYFLRLRQRAGGLRLPEQVQFDDRVVQRLLRDALALADDADHLPLLQHALARMWESARTHCGMAEDGVPPAVTWADLQAAVQPPVASARRGQAQIQLHPDGSDLLNVLRASLEHWAQFVYEQRTEAQRAQLDRVLRHLAFKDPNNGLYFQRRVEVDDAQLFPNATEPAVLLRELLVHGFIDGVNYLFWDKENPKRVTLKVSHEAFIRGWQHFRDIVDAEAARFDEFVSVLRRCAMWAGSRDTGQLLEASEIARLESLHLASVFSDQSERRDWFGVLLQYHDGQRLSKLEGVAEDYLRTSRAQREDEQRRAREAAEREQQHEQYRRETRERELLTEAERLKAVGEADRASAGRREAELTAMRAQAVSRRNRVVVALALVLAAGITLVYQLQKRVLSGVESFTTARSSIEGSDPLAGNPIPGAAKQKLEGLVLGAAAVQAGAGVRDFFDHPLLSWLGGAGPLRKAERLLALTSTEPEVNLALRTLLTSSIWAYPQSQQKEFTSASAVNASRVDRDCEVQSTQRNGSLFVDASGLPVAGRRRAIFISEGKTGDLAMHAVMYDGKTCSAGAEFWIVPGHIRPRILFDGRLRYMALVQQTDSGNFATLYEVNWQFDGQEIDRVGLQALSESTDQRHLEEVQAQFEQAFSRDREIPQRAVRAALSLPTWRVPGGYVVRVGQSYWRLINNGMQAIDGFDPSEWELLPHPQQGSACRLIEVPPLAADRRVRSTVLAWHGRCIEIQRTQRLTAAAPAASTPPATAPEAPSWDDGKPQRVDVSLYETLPPDPDSTGATQSLRRVAGFKAYDRRSGITDQSEWFIGKPGTRYAGWLALHAPTAATATSTEKRTSASATSGAAASSATSQATSGSAFSAAPLSTEALRMLGEQTLQDARAADAAASSAAPRPAAVAGASYSRR